MNEYVERDLLISMCRRKVSGKVVDGGAICMLSADQIRKVPAADVVSKGAYDQCDWERVVALTQLKEIGKSLGERMDDVRPVVRAEFVRCGDGKGVPYMCSNCGRTTPANMVEIWGVNFCPNCGALVSQEGSECGAWMCNKEEQT